MPAMFILAKIAEFLLAPADLVAGLVLIGAILLFTRRWRLGRGLVVLAAILQLGSAQIDPWLRRALEDRFALATEPRHVDGIIVLGGAIEPQLSVARGRPALGSADRVTAMVELAHRHPEARVVYSGGSGNLLDQADKEAPQLRMLLDSMGIGVAGMTFEDQSRTTHENAVFSKRLTAPQPGETWLLVTSAMHMPRAMGAFRAIGWPVIPYPVDYTTLPSTPMGLSFNLGSGPAHLQAVLHEWLGLAQYRLMGWSDSLFPGP